MNKKRFVLSRRHQKGQVAIFVALIFQVVFVFFAVLINVGLLVHHKINLQQSTDLAAYYGAMKQAEIMNMISHVNFQMRQAWKLLTWRYRVVGTFAFQAADPRPPAQVIQFPLTLSSNNPTAYNSSSDGFVCTSSGVGILDVPFFCGGHSGFKSWKASNENNCKLDCEHINQLASSMPAIPLTTGFESGAGGTGGVIKAVNQALDNANQNIKDICHELGPSGFKYLFKYIASYGAEVEQKKKLIQMLGANLSADVESAVDLEGGRIKTGAQKTFDNNLTEANRTGKLSFETVNGLSSGNCAFQGSSNDGKEGQTQFLTEIKFQFIQFFIHQCVGDKNTSKNFSPESIFTNDLQNIRSEFLQGLSASQQQQVKDLMSSVEYVIGYEKNPWCQVYYGAKAQAEPKIPFLPIAKIKLSATSFAKPFGGTIGPRYFSNWTSGQAFSDGGVKVDQNLPIKKLSGITPGLSSLNQVQTILPNYAQYVGDNKGLRDAQTVAAYQYILLYRTLSENINELRISQNKEAGATATPPFTSLRQPNEWPDITNWNRLSDPADNAYDYLATNTSGNGNSFLRDLEISVIAPNQFDLMYYSIDPDYFNNYYLKLIGGAAGTLNYSGSLSKIKSAANGFGPDTSELKADYGFNVSLANNIAAGYSVRHQIAVAAKIVKRANIPVGILPRPIDQILEFIPNNPSSLLTGWTFQNFSEFGTFPTAGPDAQNTMTFGKCNDEEWNRTGDNDIGKNYGSPVTSNLPPTPGNCVWGGRTGYSVKLISPALLRAGAPAQPYGGPNTSGSILNPVSESFFSF